MGRLDDLGVTSLMTQAESVAVAADNLGSLLEDPAGIAALRNALRLGARLIGMIRTTGLHDWWEGVEPQVLIAGGADDPNADVFDEFARRLADELAMQWNIAAFVTPRVLALDSYRLLPPVSSVVTNNRDYGDWTLSRDGQLLWWERTSEGLMLQERESTGLRRSAVVVPGRLDQIVRQAAEWISEGPETLNEETISVSEHRSLERLVRVVTEGSSELHLSAEDRVRLDVLIQTLQLQLRTPTPDRPIIGRVLRGIATIAGSLLVGVGGNYVYNMMMRFGVPWP